MLTFQKLWSHLLQQLLPQDGAAAPANDQYVRARVPVLLQQGHLPALQLCHRA